MNFATAFAVSFYAIAELLMVSLIVLIWTVVIDWLERRTYTAPPIDGGMR